MTTAPTRAEVIPVCCHQGHYQMEGRGNLPPRGGPMMFQCARCGETHPDLKSLIFHYRGHDIITLKELPDAH